MPKLWYPCAPCCNRPLTSSDDTGPLPQWPCCIGALPDRYGICVCTGDPETDCPPVCTDDIIAFYEVNRITDPAEILRRCGQTSAGGYLREFYTLDLDDTICNVPGGAKWECICLQVTCEYFSNYNPPTGQIIFGAYFTNLTNGDPFRCNKSPKGWVRFIPTTPFDCSFSAGPLELYGAGYDNANTPGHFCNGIPYIPGTSLYRAWVGNPDTMTCDCVSESARCNQVCGDEVPKKINFEAANGIVGDCTNVGSGNVYQDSVAFIGDGSYHFGPWYHPNGSCKWIVNEPRPPSQVRVSYVLQLSPGGKVDFWIEILDPRGNQRTQFGGTIPAGCNLDGVVLHFVAYEGYMPSCPHDLAPMTVTLSVP